MIEGQEGVTWEDWLALAAACEENGLTGLFTSDHYLSFHRGREQGSFDAWTVLSALAARTERIRLGTLVSPATFRHPSVLAKAATTVDHVSGGRAELGMGAGWNEEEHRTYGFPFPPLGVRMAMLAEQLRIVHETWTEASLTHEGEHYRLEENPGLPKPAQTPHPPLIVGSAGAGARPTWPPAGRTSSTCSASSPRRSSRSGRCWPRRASATAASPRRCGSRGWAGCPSAATSWWNASAATATPA